MADATRNGKLTVEGTRAQDLLSTTFDLRVIPINAGIVVSGVGVYRLRNDLFFVSTVPGEEESIQRRLEATALQSGDFVTITDITHGRSELRIVGPKSRQLLSKVCGLDFRPSQFPDQTAKQSSVAKTAQLIIRRDIGTVPAFAMIGARSFGEYLWDTLRDAGREFDLTPIGRNALHTLREQQEQQRSGS